MPRNKDQKRVIRNRMKKTGESYTAARAQVLSRPGVRTRSQPAVDYAALAGMSDEKIAAKTGHAWRDWVRLLDADGASALPHREIATILHHKHHVADWWAQTVTVGYERIKGLRQRGQRRDGAFETTKTRTFAVPVRTLYDAWADDAARSRWLDSITATVRTATAPKSVRLQWPDGAVVVALFTAKSQAKSVVALAHTKLASKAAAEESKKFWTDRLDALASLLAPSGAGRRG
jgi:hypothetical protein